MSCNHVLSPCQLTQILRTAHVERRIAGSIPSGVDGSPHAVSQFEKRASISIANMKYAYYNILQYITMTHNLVHSF